MAGDAVMLVVLCVAAGLLTGIAIITGYLAVRDIVIRYRRPRTWMPPAKVLRQWQDERLDISRVVNKRRGK